jgi:hypothetical protein
MIYLLKMECIFITLRSILWGKDETVKVENDICYI